MCKDSSEISFIMKKQKIENGKLIEKINKMIKESKDDKKNFSLKKMVNENEENFLLKNELKKINKFISNDINKGVDQINVISIIGDRGFGKTTLINKIESLEKDKIMILDNINPINLMVQDQDKQYTFVELVLSAIYGKIKKDVNVDINKMDVIIEEINEIIKIINQKSKTSTDMYDSGLYTVEKINNIQGLKYKLNELTEKYLEIINKKKLVVIFDDFDLFNQQLIQNIVSDLNLFVGNEKIIFILAYNEQNLINNFLEFKLKNNQELLKNDLISKNMIKNQVTNELNKVIPPDKKVYLPEMKDILSKDASEYYCFEEKKSTIIGVLDAALEIASPMSLKGYLSIENRDILLPKSIRELEQMNRRIEYLLLIDDELIKINEFKIWIIELINQKLTNNEYKEFINEWIKQTDKNSFTVSELRKLTVIRENKGKIKNPVFEKSDRDLINIALGDVSYILNGFYEFDSSVEGKIFIYVLKILFSLEMKYLLVEYQDNKKELILNQYKQIAKGYPIPLDRNYFDTTSWNFQFCLDDFKKDIYEHEKVIMLYNIISPYPVGVRFDQNSSFLSTYLYQLDKTNRKENKIELFEFDRKPLEKFNVENINDENNVKEVREYLSSGNFNYLPSYFLYTNPFVFLLTDLYIKWALDNKYFVVWNMFTLDALYELKTQRSTEMEPMLKVYKSLDSAISSSEDNSLYQIWDINNRCKQKEIKINKEISIMKWWNEKFKVKSSEKNERKAEKSMTKFGLEQMKKEIQEYTIKYSDLKVENLSSQSEEEIMNLYAYMQDKKANNSEKNKRKNMTSRSKWNIENLDNNLEEIKKYIQDEKSWKEINQKFDQKFNYKLKEYEEDKKYYSGNEIENMNSFFQNEIKEAKKDRNNNLSTYQKNLTKLKDVIDKCKNNGMDEILINKNSENFEKYQRIFDENRGENIVSSNNTIFTKNLSMEKDIKNMEKKMLDNTGFENE